VKKAMIILFTFIVIVGISYFFLFVKAEVVVNDKLLSVRNQTNGILVSTMESSKYLGSYNVKRINDSTAGISIYTTSLFNVFARKITGFNIALDKKVKNIVIAGKMMERDNLVFDK
jgi:hypothetical protein